MVGGWYVSPSPVDPSLRALSGRLKINVRRHDFNEVSLIGGRLQGAEHERGPATALLPRFFFSDEFGSGSVDK